MDTKERIIYESLKLFSVNGFDAVSTRMIAKAAGVSDTAMYKHFKGKRDIFDSIIELCKKRYLRAVEKADIYHMHWDDVEQICLDIFMFQTRDEWIVMFRRLLVIEQFKNPEMSRLYRSFFIDMPVEGQSMLFTKLMDAGYMKRRDPKVLSMELYAPFFMYHTVNEDYDELLKNLREHVTYFRNNYRTKLCDNVPDGMGEEEK